MKLKIIAHALTAKSDVFSKLMSALESDNKKYNIENKKLGSIPSGEGEFDFFSKDTPEQSKWRAAHDKLYKKYGAAMKKSLSMIGKLFDSKKDDEDFARNYMGLTFIDGLKTIEKKTGNFPSILHEALRVLKSKAKEIRRKF